MSLPYCFRYGVVMTTDTETNPGRFVATRRHDTFGITIPSGEFVPVEPIPPGYCPHGKYVGGCGIDWMCQACEMGDDDYDLADLDSMIRYHHSKFVEAVNLGAMILLSPMSTNHKFALSFAGRSNEEMRIRGNLVREFRATKAMFTKLAHGPDDRRWWSRAQDMVTELAYNQGIFDEDGPRQYTETDEIHEYGYVPEGGEI